MSKFNDNLEQLFKSQQVDNQEQNNLASLYNQQVNNSAFDVFQNQGANSLTPKDFNFEEGMGSGYVEGTDVNSYKASSLTSGQKIGRTIGNALFNAVLQPIEAIGYAGALATEWGDERDYQNALTKFVKKSKNPLGEVYRENPDDLFDFSDEGTWYNYGQSITESAFGFALTGAGIGKGLQYGLKSTAQALSRTLDLSAKTANTLGKAANLTAQGLTSASLGYVEGAMSGANVYENVGKVLRDKSQEELYDLAIRDKVAEGKTREEAIAELGTMNDWSVNKSEDYIRHKQAVGASSTVQLNTSIMTMLNFPTLNTLFKAENALNNIGDDLAKVGLERNAGESIKDFVTRLKTNGQFDKLPSSLKKQIVGQSGGRLLLEESGRESVEEIANLLAEEAGQRLGTSGKGEGVANMIAEIEIGDAFTKEGALAAMLGFVGGFGQKGLLDFTPVVKTEKADDGTVKSTGLTIPFFGQNMSSIERENKIVEYENARNQFINVMEDYQSLQEGLKQKAQDIRGMVQGQNFKEDDFLKTVEEYHDLRKGVFYFDHIIRQNISPNGIAVSAFKKDLEIIRDLDNQKDLGEEVAKRLDEVNQSLQQTPDDESLLKAKSELEKEYQKKKGLTQAMEAGYAESPDDNYYKKEAEDAIKMTEYSNEVWKNLNDKFGTVENLNSGYISELFREKVSAFDKDNIAKQQRTKRDEAILNKTQNIDDLELKEYLITKNKINVLETLSQKTNLSEAKKLELKNAKEKLSSMEKGTLANELVANDALTSFVKTNVAKFDDKQLKRIGIADKNDINTLTLTKNEIERLIADDSFPLMLSDLESSFKSLT